VLAKKKLYASLIKYGIDSHIFEVLEYCNKEDLRKKEAEYGIAHNVLSKFNLNLALPKINEEYCAVSDEVRKSISVRQLNNTYSKDRILTDIHKKRISESNKGKKRSKEVIEKMKLKVFTDETRQKMSLAKIGKKMSKDHKLKLIERNTGINNKQSKLILDLNSGIYYYSLSELSFSSKISKTVLSNMLSGVKFNKTNYIYV